MASTYEKLSSNKAKLTITVPAADFEKALTRAYHKLAGRFNISGFRRGKAPMRVIENYYGAGVFYDEALNDLLPEVYRAATEEHGLVPVDKPEIDVAEIGRGKDLVLTAEVFVEPDVTLGEYTHLGLKKTEPDEVTEDDVSAEIERARDRNSRMVEVTDRPVQMDDVVNIDYEGSVDGELFEGGADKGHDLTVGSGTFIPGFEEQLVGHAIGEEVTVSVTFPEEYHAKELAGKAAQFKVKINGIKVKELPEVDDDFAQEVSESANTVDEYRAEIRARLEKSAADRADAAFENEVLEAVTENAEIDVPAAMIEDEVDRMVRNFEMQLMYQGMRLDDYFKYTGQTREQMRDAYRSQAEEQVRMRLVLTAVQKKEQIEASEEDVDAEIARFAEQSRKTVEEVKATFGEGDIEYFRDAATVKKTIEFLKANAE